VKVIRFLLPSVVSSTMDADELRVIIWDYLFRTRASRTLDEIAAYCGKEPQAITAAVDHEWFKVSADNVMIAYGTRL
jgi:hypothetical protein